MAVCFIMASYSGCDRLAAILFFSFASGFSGLDNSRVNNMDLSPNYAPTIIAIVNSCGSVMGILAPVAVGLLTTNVSLDCCCSTPDNSTSEITRNDLDLRYLDDNNVASITLVDNIFLSFQSTIYEWRFEAMSRTLRLHHFQVYFFSESCFGSLSAF